MRDASNTLILKRLLAATYECRDAFTEAAFVSGSPRLSALFVRRAQHQGRIAAFLEERLGNALTTAPAPVRAIDRGTRGTQRMGTLRRSSDPDALLGACLRVLDVSISEFSRAYGPSMPLAQRISLERHHDQMRWSRDELVAFRQSCKNVRIARPKGDIAPPLVVDGEAWFGVPALSTLFLPLIPRSLIEFRDTRESDERANHERANHERANDERANDEGAKQSGRTLRFSRGH